MEDDRGSRASRFARVSSKWNNSVAGLIGFLDNIRVWELAGDIPPQFYTFPMMFRVLGLATSFSMVVALVGNIFDFLKYFIGAHLTPVWYAIVFVFFYIRYYGSFGSFGINVYRTVIGTTIVTLFVVDNLFRNGLAFIGELLKYSAYPEFSDYLPSYGIQFYHFIYLAVLAMPKKKDDSVLKSKPLYSSKLIEIDSHTYDSLVEAGESNESTHKVTDADRHEPTPQSSSTPTTREGVNTEDERERIKELIREHIDKEYEAFLWDKNVYVSKELVDKYGISTNGFKKVRIFKDGELITEGDYLVLYASEIMDKGMRKKVMNERMKDPQKRDMFRNLKVEVVS